MNKGDRYELTNEYGALCDTHPIISEPPYNGRRFSPVQYGIYTYVDSHKCSANGTICVFTNGKRYFAALSRGLKYISSSNPIQPKITYHGK